MTSNSAVILGCGLSGSIMALSLAKFGIQCKIIESKNIEDPSFCNDIRTIALTANSRSLFESIDIWESLSSDISIVKDVYVVDNKSSQMLHFASQLINTSNIGYMIKASDLKKNLLKKLKENEKFIQIIHSTNYESIKSDHGLVRITLPAQTLDCALLILCDGANSAIKGRYFVNNISCDYRQIAIVFDIKHERPHEGTAVEHFLPQGPFAILPLRDQLRSSIVWTVDDKHASLLQSLDIAELEYFAQQNCGNSFGKIKIDSKISCFPLKAQLVDKYFYERIVLVSDTAHVIHPLAGQGLNQGIKDIQLLSELIYKDFQLFKDITQESLKKYNDIRYKDNKAMFAITNVLNNIFSNDTKILRVARRLGLFCIENVNPLKKILMRYAMGDR